MPFLRLVLAATLCVFALLGCGRSAPVVAPLEDRAGILSDAERARIGAALTRYERETTHQIGVLTVPRLDGESIDAFALRTANEWRLGRAGIDNGMLVVVALEERTSRIELGRGFEPHISNERAQEIRRAQMNPAFRERRYAEGIEAGLAELMREGRRLVAPR